jgi:uncharacterized membrane protein
VIFVVVLAVIAVTILAGIMLRLIVRANPSDTAKWEGTSPFIYIGCGLVALVVGWFERRFGVPAVIVMLTGATAGYGVFLAVRNYAKGSKPTVREDD